MMTLLAFLNSLSSSPTNGSSFSRRAFAFRSRSGLRFAGEPTEGHRTRG